MRLDATFSSMIAIVGLLEAEVNGRRKNRERRATADILEFRDDFVSTISRILHVHLWISMRCEVKAAAAAAKTRDGLVLDFRLKFA